MERILEYGVLGICVCALSWVVYRFVLTRMSAECESLRKEIAQVRRRYDAIVMQQISDYKTIIRSHNEGSSKMRRTLSSANEVMQAVLKRMGDSGPDE